VKQTIGDKNGNTREVEPATPLSKLASLAFADRSCRNQAFKV
jgi:hypothetical protein